MKQPSACHNTIRIQVNDRPLDLPQACTVQALLQQLALRGGPVAVECNREIIPATRFTDYLLQDGDRLEIVSLTGGG